jgi:hypothetical protein
MKSEGPRKKPKLSAPPSTSQVVMDLAAAAMLEELKESRWFQSAPAQARAEDPTIEITGVEYRDVCTTIGGGLGGGSTYKMPFIVGQVEVGGISAKLALRIDFGVGGFLVLEGE